MAAVITSVPATLEARGPAQEQPREEDHGDHEHDTGDDGHPRLNLTQTARRAVSGLSSHGGRFDGGFRRFSHGSKDGTRIPHRGRDYWP